MIHAPAMNSPADTVDITVGGKYRLLEPIAQRSGYTAYRARHELIERYYVVSVFEPSPQADAASGQQFLDEAGQASRLNHPHLLPVVDFGVLTDGRAYLVHELPFSRRLSDESAPGPLPLRKALKLFIDTVDAVAYLHDHGVVHGRIDAWSVLVMQRDGVSFAKLIDSSVPRAPSAKPADDVAALARLMTDMLTGVSNVEMSTPPRLPKHTPPWLARTLEQAASGDRRAPRDAAELGRTLKGAVDLHEMATPTQSFPVLSTTLVPLPIALSAAAIGILGLLFALWMLHPELAPKPKESAVTAATSDQRPAKEDQDSDPLVSNTPAATTASAMSAENLYYAGKYAQAATAYQKEIAEIKARGAASGCLILPYYRCAFCEAAVKQFDGAARDYQAAIDLYRQANVESIELVNTYCGLSIAERGRGRLAESEAALKTAIAIKEKLKAAGDNRDEPSERMLRTGLANLYKETGRPFEAKLEFQKVLADDPTEPLPTGLLVNASAELAEILIAETRLDEAQAQLTRAQQLADQAPRLDAVVRERLRTVWNALSVKKETIHP